MSASLKAAQIIRCINAGISCLASTFIMLMILHEQQEGKGLASPYSRIIFAMSISDILFSLGIFLSPFMSPKDTPDALFAIGTTESCEAIGFLFLLGFQSVMLYTVCLTYFFMRRIKYKVTPQKFAKKEEKYFHIFFIVLSLSMAIAALIAGSINPLGIGTICGVGSFPEFCTNESWEGEPCERGDDQITKYLSIYGGALVSLSFLFIAIILALFTHHVYKEERTFNIPARAIGDVNNNRRNAREVAPEAQEEQVVDRNDRQNRHALTKQALVQSLLYILAFFIVHFPPYIRVLKIRFGKDTDFPEWLFWLISLITPLGGVFNILIYTRPKVLRLKEDYPNAPYLRVLLVIVLTGGEIPSLADLRRTTTPQLDEQRNNRSNQEVNDRSEEEQFNEHEEQGKDSLEDYYDDLFSFDMDISAASDYLSYYVSG